MIVPVGKGKYVAKSESGRRFSKPVSKAKARKRIAQMEYFKHHDQEDMRNGYRKHY